jgi:hypothetical protein
VYDLKNSIGGVIGVFFLVCVIFIEICTFVSWIHEVPVPYSGLVNISKAHIYKDVSIC